MKALFYFMACAPSPVECVIAQGSGQSTTCGYTLQQGNFVGIGSFVL